MADRIISQKSLVTKDQDNKLYKILSEKSEKSKPSLHIKNLIQK